MLAEGPPREPHQRSRDQADPGPVLPGPGFVSLKPLIPGALMRQLKDPRGTCSTVLPTGTGRRKR
jgi:hypothetical protein